MRKHSNHLANHYKSLNILSDQSQLSVNVSNDFHAHPLVEDECKSSSPLPNLVNHRSTVGHLPSKTVSSSIADLSLSTHSPKISSTTIRLASFQSKLDSCHMESYKKIPLSQSFDWGILAVTNNDLILLYNKDKSSLVIFDAQGQENEVRDSCCETEGSRGSFLENSMVRWRDQRSVYLS